MKDFELLNCIFENEFGSETGKPTNESIEMHNNPGTKGKKVSSKASLELEKANPKGGKVGTGSPTSAKAPGPKGVAIKTTKVTGKKMKPKGELNDDMDCIDPNSSCTQKLPTTKTNSSSNKKKLPTKELSESVKGNKKKVYTESELTANLQDALTSANYEGIISALSDIVRTIGDKGLQQAMSAVANSNGLAANPELGSLWNAVISNPHKNFRQLILKLKDLAKSKFNMKRGFGGSDSFKPEDNM
ncbi:MAG: hypothetical protein BWY04_01174 [candidate division CPR1 bacterium ADurb.Bin160]|uniref:Uncharacterized protein n=1 Tax=candidate division CPR1 bacterium ADurb.Bin160 TaxID=1852826 RepID=A0A1V5ZKY2_9BACT|nr:MAG: hypothetical protein BWY04_01174 [candidate division CPR1 bacterium ADurb.Bin160]